MTVKNIVLAVTLVLGATSLALAQTNTRIGPAGVLTGGYRAYQGYQSSPGVSYPDNPFEITPDTPGSSGF